MPVSSRPISSTITPRPGICCSISMNEWLPLGQHDLRAAEQPAEDAVEQPEHRLQHPDGDRQRQPDEQAGEQVFLHGASDGASAAALAGRRRRRGRRRARAAAQLRSRTTDGEAPAAARLRARCRPSAGVAASAAARFAAVAALAGVAALSGAGLPVASPPRKSVTYQPEPLSWKPAAVTCLTNVGCAARRADGEQRIGHLLQDVLRVPAGRAAVGVDRHRGASRSGSD